MIKLKKLSFLLLSFLIVFGCAKEDNEDTPIDPTDLIGGWQIVRYDYTELINGVLNANKTVSLNSPGIIYFNQGNKASDSE